MVALRDMLDYIDFEIEIVDGKDEFEGEKVIRLIDKQGADIGNIHDKQFPIDSDFIPMILDRLEPYWNDYIIEGLAKNVGLPTEASYEDVYNTNVKFGDLEREEMKYLYAVIHPEKVVCITNLKSSLFFKMPCAEVVLKVFGEEQCLYWADEIEIYENVTYEIEEIEEIEEVAPSIIKLWEGVWTVDDFINFEQCVQAYKKARSE